ncbi:MFS transporter [Aquirufa rosea]|uniref:MFS transporter n=1 Tax=Aquirufa rosea TaxID=2509241 RepID=A0A4V1M5J1_9BACT|nr:MFS transporter [Aquirufa rosea]RXK49894.1 MFS transporter [Aquirufa rosea]
MSFFQNKDAYRALKFPEFRAFIIGNTLFTMALLMQEVIVSYEIYKITHNPLALGLIGLAEVIPYISLALFGGHYADNRDKRKIMQISLSVIILGSVLLLYSSLQLDSQSPDVHIYTIYFVIFLIGLAKGFFSPAASSLNPFLVPKEVFANAATWNSSFWQLGAILGPGMAGFLYAYLGLAGSLETVIVFLLGVMTCLFFIKKRPVPPKAVTHESIWHSLKEGILYVFKTKIILYAISLDLFSVLFGGVIAILPIFAEDILKVGAEGLGILRAAPSIGALLSMAFMIYFPPLEKAWRNLLLAIAGFGVATLVFGISTNFWISVVALFFTGAFDSVSVVIRQTVLRFYTPDEMRGRVSAVNGIFVSSSNELGAFESGLMAKLLGTVPSVLVGASATLIIVSLVAFNSKDLLRLKVAKKIESED